MHAYINTGKISKKKLAIETPSQSQKKRCSNPRTLLSKRESFLSVMSLIISQERAVHPHSSCGSRAVIEMQQGWWGHIQKHNLFAVTILANVLKARSDAFPYQHEHQLRALVPGGPINVYS